MAQFNRIDSNRPQRLLIAWQALHEHDETAGRPDERDEGFYPSLDPNEPGYIGEPAPDDIDGKAQMARYREQFNAADSRMESWERDEWHYIGVRARASLQIPIGGNSFRLLTLESAGLWGIESDSSPDYLAEVYQEERAGLLSELRALGAALASGEYDETESGSQGNAD